jgi:triosephosphate isomerase
MRGPSTGLPIVTPGFGPFGTSISGNWTVVRLSGCMGCDAYLLIFCLLLLQIIMGGGNRPRRLVGVSLKMYFSLSRTHEYITAVSKLQAPANVDVFVIPDFLSIVAASDLLKGTGFMLGAQDTFWEGDGAFTGEVSPAVLREAGCTFVEIGHAERRRIFSETDSDVVRKTAAAVRHGLVPLVCIGEQTEGNPDVAIAEVRAQVEPLLAAIPDDAELVLAYEPVWAIGQPKPASAAHVVQVAKGIRALVASRKGQTRILYGGSAGPGLFASLAEGVDGLFLGRFAHDINAFQSVIGEIAQEG